MQSKLIACLIAISLLVIIVGAKSVTMQPSPAADPTVTPTVSPTVSPTPSPSPKASPTLTPSSTTFPAPLQMQQGIGVTVTPWGDMYRHEPDCKSDFSVELFSPDQNTCFANDSFNIVFHSGAFFWIVEKAYYTSNLFSGEKWIAVSKHQYTQDLQKTFTFSLSGVPEGNHFLSLTVIFHEGTRNNATAYFTVG